MQKCPCRSASATGTEGRDRHDLSAAETPEDLLGFGAKAGRDLIRAAGFLCYLWFMIPD